MSGYFFTKSIVTTLTILGLGSILLSPIQLISVHHSQDPISTPDITPIPSNMNALLNRVEEVESDLDVIKQAVESNREIFAAQERVFSATVQRIEWTFNVLIVILTVTGILIGVFSFAFLNRLIEKAAADWFDQNAATHIEKTTEQALARLEEKYDKKFADLYQKVETAFTKGDGQ